MNRNKYGLMFKSLPFVLGLVIVKIAVDLVGFDVISTNTIINAFVAGVIFTIAIIFTGTLTDFKESERIPGDLAASICSLHKDSRFASMKDSSLTTSMQSHVEEVHKAMTSNFRKNEWKLGEIRQAINSVDLDIERLAREGIAPPIIVRMRNETSTLERLANRIEVIERTSFIPAAYMIAEIAIVMVMIVLLFARMNTRWEGPLMVGAISFLLITLLLLIKDMDNPFEMNNGSSADVDMKILFELEGNFNQKPGSQV